MQQLSQRRPTDTPRNIPHVPGNCGASLNSPEGRDGVACLKTCDNNSDAVLTVTGQTGWNLRVSAVYVLNLRGKPLMPCSPGKARILLKTGGATVHKRTPFIIRLNHASGEALQPVTLGVDAGYKNIGLSAVSPDKELYAAEVNLRTDMVKLNSERRQYRRTRRNRKTWYRKPRFLNRKKAESWLAPSIQHKKDSHIKVIKLVSSFLPVNRVIVEVAAFDIQKIKNPGIEGTGYQNGEQKDFWNTREYVLYRDDHTCRNCKGKSKDPVLEVHHLLSRQIGGDRPGNLLTLCQTCHDGVSGKRIILKAKPSKGFRAETFISMVRWRIVNELKKDFDAIHTYGYITKGKRIELGLPKSHIHDAFVIAGGNGHVRSSDQYQIRQVRKCNRKLFKGERSHIRNTAARIIHGFQRYDKVKWKGNDCFVFGRRSTGYFDLRKGDGSKVHASVHASNMLLLERATTLLTERRKAAILPGPLNGKNLLVA